VSICSLDVTGETLPGRYLADIGDRLGTSGTAGSAAIEPGPTLGDAS
jgi:hypothetical protein